MTDYTLYYATNRDHIGEDRWNPTGYGIKFSDDGMENLRFGVVTVKADEQKVADYMNADMQNCGRGDGISLGNYLAECAKTARIKAYRENIGDHIADTAQKNAVFGSQSMFADIQKDMENSSDVLIYIHGFNVSWADAVGAALALQIMQQNSPRRDPMQSALDRTFEHTPGSRLPRIFEHVYLCAADVDDNALEAGQPLERIDQIARCVTIYHNRNDKAMWVSDYTKGNPERLGHTGAAHPSLLHNKVHQVDCTPVVHDLVQHSYYLIGNINADIRASLDGWEQDDPRRQRVRSGTQNNLWVMK